MGKEAEIKREENKTQPRHRFVNGIFRKHDGLERQIQKRYHEIYQQLGLAWQYLSEHCGHDDGYKKTKESRRACKICGQVE